MTLQNGYDERGQAQRATGFNGSASAAPMAAVAPAAAPAPAAPVTTTVTPGTTTPAVVKPHPAYPPMWDRTNNQGTGQVGFGDEQQRNYARFHPTAPGVATQPQSPQTPVPAKPVPGTPPPVTTPAPAPVPVPATPTTKLASVFQMPGLPAAPQYAVMPRSPQRVCYAKGTEVRMADGSWKPVEAIKLLEEVMLGGTVIGRGEALSDNAFRYKGQIVTGSHAVFDTYQPAGYVRLPAQFRRVEDTNAAEPFDLGKDGKIIVYPIVTSNHLMVLRTHIAADFAETDASGDQLPEQRLGELNADAGRLQCLAWIADEGSVFGDGSLPARGSLRDYQDMVAGEGWKPVPAA